MKCSMFEKELWSFSWIFLQKKGGMLGWASTHGALCGGGSHLVQEALEHAGSFHRQRPWDANGLLKNHCRRKEKDSNKKELEGDNRRAA